jgi:c-di-GMP phosphodiesterase
MDVFIGKQPILNKHEEVIAYELLYRNKNLNVFPNVDQDDATMNVIINALFTFGIDRLTDNKPCFINFSENLIMHDFLFQLNPQNIVIEILEDVEITEQLIKRIEVLKQFGFQIALDDYTHDRELSILHHRLFSQLDILKIDFLHTSIEKRKYIANYFQTYYPSIALLAEKVETREQYEAAVTDGYSLFQGYFFEQPKILMSNDIETATVQYFKILSLLKSEEPDIDIIAKTIECDLSLTYKLLKLINTANTRVRSNITSIRQAIMIIGLLELNKWIYLLAVRGTQTSSQNNKLIQISLFRSKVCEMLARQKGFKNYEEYYLAGMFSNIDAILQIPMEKITNELPFSTIVLQTISKEETEMTPYLKLAIALQKLDWDVIIQLAEELDFSLESLEILYYRTNEWIENVITIEKSSM